MQALQFSGKGKRYTVGLKPAPIGFNNIGEFTDCLKGMQCARSMTNEIEVVGDCIILTKAALKTHAIKNYALNELLCEICKLAMCFDEIEFIHVPQELNKQADAIATAASWSKEDGTCAVIDHHWNLRVRTKVGKEIPMHSVLKRLLNLIFNLFLPSFPFLPPSFPS